MSITLTPHYMHSGNCVPSDDCLTPNFVTYSDSYTPIIPSILRPIAVSVLVPGSGFSLPKNFDLNKDERVHKQVAKYFKYKVLDKWIYDDMRDLLNFFIVTNNRVTLTDNLSGTQNETPEAIEAKIDFIEKNILTKDTMHRILKKFVKGTGINWYDLHKNEFFVKEDIKKQLSKILKETIAENKQSQK